MKRFRSNLLSVCICSYMLSVVSVASGVGILPYNNDYTNARAVGNVTGLAFDTTRATFNQSQTIFQATAGRSYLFEVLGYNSDGVGEGVLTVSSESSSPSSGSNDDLAFPKPVGDVTDLPFDTTSAELDGPHFCMISPNIWFCYTASCTGKATVSLAGSSFDTMLAVYDGCDYDFEYTDLIECNDDSHNTRQSEVVFDAIAGNQYLIEVGGFEFETGPGLLSISCGGVTPPPSSKDDCQNAKAIGDIENLAFDTTDATFDGPGLCMTSPNIWYCYTATCTGNVTVSLAGSSFDTMLAVYDGCGCYPNSNDLIECNDDAGGGYQSEVTFAAIEGNQYLIEVGGSEFETGQGLLSISCEGVTPPPSSKDDCENAESIGEVENLSFDTTDAIFDGPGLCMTSPNIWYCYTATCTGNVTVSLAGSSFDTMLAVYDGCGCYPNSNDLIECNDDAGSGYQSEVTFVAIEGNQYLIEIGGYGDEKGEGLLNITCEGTVLQNKPDLGDAPDSTNNSGVAMTAYPTQGMLQVIVQANYPTVYNDGTGTGPYGPVHLNTQTVAFLGKKITREIEADTGVDEDGVNNIRPSTDAPDRDQGDDGVVFPLKMPNCRYTTIDYIVNVVDPGTDLWVNVWLDWNRDGDWDDTLECPRGSVPEWAVQNQFLPNLPAGLNQITTPGFLSWHPENGREDIWMRITLSGRPYRGGSNPGAKGNAGSGPRTKYEIGETEDYHFTPDVSSTICEDFNGDGVIDMDDLAYFTAEWLESCP